MRVQLVIAAFVFISWLGTLPFARAEAEPAAPQPAATSFFANETYWGRSFDSTSFKIMGYGVLGSVAAAGRDNWVRENGGRTAIMSEETANYGDFLGTGAPGALVALGQLIWDRENGEAHTKTLIATTLWTYTFKTAISRKRPGSSQNRQSWPSGHVSTTSATATSLWYSYGWKVGAPAAALAVFTAGSRIADDAHFLSDVIGGAVVGLWLGRAYHHRSKSSQLEAVTGTPAASQKLAWEVIPSFGNETVFVSFLSDF